MMYRFLFPQRILSKDFSLFLLALRLLFGILLMTHGFAKLRGWDSLSASFPDPLGIGSTVSLALAVFGEFFCPIAFIAGFLYRLSMLPMLTAMAVAFFVVHGGSIAEGELSFIYLAVFLPMYLAGPGRYSLDRRIAARLRHQKIPA